MNWKEHAKIALRFYLKNIFLSIGITIAAFIAGTIGVILTQDENGFLTPLYMTILVLNILTLPLQGKWMKQSVEKQCKYDAKSAKKSGQQSDK